MSDIQLKTEPAGGAPPDQLPAVIPGNQGSPEKGSPDKKKLYLILAGGGVALLALAAVLAIVLFPDKAKPAYDECVAWEAKGELIKARDACQVAVKADANSKAGKQAVSKLEMLTPLAAEIEKKQAAAKEARERPCKSGKWVTRCSWKGKKRPTLLDGPTFARCNQDAHELRSIVGMVCPTCVCVDDFKEDEEGGEGAGE